MTTPISSKRKLAYAVMTVVFLGALVAVWEWVFRRYFGQSYLSWCLEFGPNVLLLNTLIAAIWREFEEREDLISDNPNVFLAGWFHTIAGISISFANSSRAPFGSETNVYWHWNRLLDALFALVVTLVIIPLLWVWAALALPFLYFVLLISGSPVRESIRCRVAGSQTKFSTLELEVNDKDKTKFNFGFDENPVASAFALGALVVWMAKLFIPN